MNEFDYLRAASKQCKQNIEALGLEVFRAPDVKQWASFVKALETRRGKGSFPMSHSFNPGYNEALNENNSFSITVAGHEGYMVAGIAVRRYEGTVKDVCLSGALWTAYAHLTECDFEVHGWPKGKQWQLIGPCAQRGGLYVDEDYQGKKIATNLELIALYDMFLNPDFLEVRHAVGLRRHGDKRKGVSARRALFATAAIGMDRPTKLDLVHSSRLDVVQRAQEQLAASGNQALDRVVAFHDNGNVQPDNARVIRPEHWNN